MRGAMRTYGNTKGNNVFGFRILLLVVGLLVVSLAVAVTNAQLGWIIFGTGLFLLGLVANKMDE